MKKDQTMIVVTNGEKFRIKYSNGEFVTTVITYFLGPIYTPIEFDTQSEADAYVKYHTWTPVHAEVPKDA